MVRAAGLTGVLAAVIGLTMGAAELPSPVSGLSAARNKAVETIRSVLDGVGRTYTQVAVWLLLGG